MRAWWVGLALLLATANACTGAARDEEILIFAAASLTDAFTDLARAFEEESGTPVLLNLAGSQQLARQIVEGAPADLFASADRRQIDPVREAGRLAGEPVPFARNRMVIAVERGNPLGITGLADLARPGLVVVMAADQVPAGAYARQALERAGVTLEPSSVEADVRAVLGKVVLGEADAGIVYASDVRADTVESVPIPPEHDPAPEHWIALLDGRRPGAAEDFLAFLLSPDGRRILESHGFQAP